MEIATLLASFLTPFLPYLLNLGKPVAESAGQKLGANLGEGAWEKAKQLWSKLAPNVAEKPLAQGAAEALAEDAQDPDAQEILTKQLSKLLAANPDLAQTVQQLLATDAEVVSKVVSITQQVKGDKNIVIGEASGQVNIRQG